MRTRTRIGQGTVALLAALWALPSWSAAVSGQGTWESTLQPRYFNNDATPDAFYDTDRNITWLADANYANTSGHDADGRMNWANANAWAVSLDLYGPSGADGWRLPAVTDTGTSGCDWSYSGGTDCGYNVDTATGEMAHMFYDELGNKAYCPPGDATCSGGPQSGWGLTNPGPFSNVQSYVYWSGTQYAPDSSVAWYFNFNFGGQSLATTPSEFYAWAVHSGDVGAATPVPVPAAAWLLGSGLLGLFGVARPRRLALR